ncbi:unnamed protein product, partial [marine sediment metagenome]
GSYMRQAVKRDMDDSAYDFKRVVWPVIKNHCGGQCVVIEGSQATGMDRSFDTLAGVDTWCVDRDKQVISGIASRIQWGLRVWRTFTVRKSRSSGARTEFRKRLDSLEAGTLYPTFSVHAYVTRRKTGDLIAAAVIDTRELYRHVAENVCKIQVNPYDHNEFFVVPWDAFDSKSTLRVFDDETRDYLP